MGRNGYEGERPIVAGAGVIAERVIRIELFSDTASRNWSASLME